MIEKDIKKDFAVLWAVYTLAILFLILILAFAVPLSIRKMGIFIPSFKKSKVVSGYYDKNAFNNISVEAKSFIVYDVVTREVIAGKNENIEYPLASITKIMTALTALEIAPSSSKIIITKGGLDGGYDLGLKEKQVWSLEELLKYTLVFSSNDGAQLIADKLLGREKFVRRMNSYSKELGFNMKFTQPAGLDVNGKLGGIGSAYDVARMMSLARMELGNILDSTTKTRLNVKSSTGMIVGIPNTNQHIDEFIGVEASKTGFTDSAGGNLVLSVDAYLGHPVIIVILGSTRDARFSDAYTLYLALIKSIR
ncbi:TPA: hypothetical protein DEP94_00090 [Candidatus Nomurabacteria bacterium]|nr:hypothetical protein [Candidatus Nomurabacteria bacterium]